MRFANFEKEKEIKKLILLNRINSSLKLFFHCRSFMFTEQYYCLLVCTLIHVHLQNQESALNKKLYYLLIFLRKNVPRALKGCVISPDESLERKERISVPKSSPKKWFFSFIRLEFALLPFYIWRRTRLGRIPKKSLRVFFLKLFREPTLKCILWNILWNKSTGS